MIGYLVLAPCLIHLTLITHSTARTHALLTTRVRHRCDDIEATPRQRKRYLPRYVSSRQRSFASDNRNRNSKILENPRDMESEQSKYGKESKSEFQKRKTALSEFPRQRQLTPCRCPTSEISGQNGGVSEFSSVKAWVNKIRIPGALMRALSRLYDGVRTYSYLFDWTYEQVCNKLQYASLS